jgi:hypothetical protein
MVCIQHISIIVSKVRTLHHSLGATRVCIAPLLDRPRLAASQQIRYHCWSRSMFAPPDAVMTPLRYPMKVAQKATNTACMYPTCGGIRRYDNAITIVEYVIIYLQACLRYRAPASHVPVESAALTRCASVAVIRYDDTAHMAQHCTIFCCEYPNKSLRWLVTLTCRVAHSH